MEVSVTVILPKEKIADEEKTDEEKT